MEKFSNFDERLVPNCQIVGNCTSENIGQNQAIYSKIRDFPFYSLKMFSKINKRVVFKVCGWKNRKINKRSGGGAFIRHLS